MDRKYNIEKLPKSYRSDVKTAINILAKEGCKEIYLFGSLVDGESTDRSDIDLTVTGIRKEDFFEIYGELMMSLEHPVDLINLEKKSRFVSYLKEKGEMVRVA
jgi:predicted nucleotidyltransferase